MHITEKSSHALGDRVIYNCKVLTARLPPLAFRTIHANLLTKPSKYGIPVLLLVSMYLKSTLGW